MWGQDLNTKPPGENKLNGSQSTTLDTTCAEEQSHTNLQIVPRGHNSPEFLNLSSQTHFGQITPRILFKFTSLPQEKQLIRAATENLSNSHFLKVQYF